VKADDLVMKMLGHEIKLNHDNDLVDSTDRALFGGIAGKKVWANRAWQQRRQVKGRQVSGYLI
jgi:hypothetical protein